MLYREIALQIAELLNKHPKTDKMPTEKELMETYDASRNTVRMALKMLTEAGILTARAGLGYFVNHWALNDTPTLNFNARNSFTRQFYPYKENTQQELLRFDTIACPEEVATLMKIKTNSMMYLVMRHRDIGGYHENYEYTLLSQDAVPYLNEDIARGHIFEFIQKHYRLTDEHSEYYIRQSKSNNPFSDRLDNPKMYVTAVHICNQSAFAYSEVYYTNSDTAFYIRS